MIRFIFLSLKFCEFSSFYMFGKMMDKSGTKKNYYMSAFLPILVYTMVEGLRFGRRIDWNIYCQRYNEIESYDKFLSEPIFYWTSLFLRDMGLPYPFFIVLLSLLFIVSAVIYLSNYKGCLEWAMPLLLLYTSLSENYIRWYFGISFVLLSLHFLQNIDYVKSLIFAIVSVLIHNGIIFIYPFFFLTFFDEKKIIPKNISILLVFFTTFFGNISSFNFIQGIAMDISFLTGDDYSVSNYLGKVDDIVSGNFGSIGYIRKNIRTQIINFILSILFIYYGYPNSGGKKYSGIYNFFVIGVILSPIFTQVEIFDRYADFLCIFTCIIGANAIKYLYGNSRLLVVVIIVCLLYNIYLYLYLFRNEYTMLFIWDSDGRDLLPYWNLRGMW